MLEIKSRRGSLDHLGPLAAIGLYENDRQIREVRYRQVTGTAPRYTVRLWSLEDLPGPPNVHGLGPR